MTHRRRRARLLVLLLSPLWLLGLALLAGFRVNHTHSFPVGIYRTVPKAPEVGDLVLFRPPEDPVFDQALSRGYIGSGGFTHYEMMLKRLVAVGGDVVKIDTAGVTVNGRLLANSKPQAVDLAGRPLPVWHLKDYRLSAGEVLLMSDYSPSSFDARYFGPIPRAQIQSVVRPVWTW
jgi:conjugative transfer signal peptidase TraF